MDPGLRYFNLSRDIAHTLCVTCQLPFTQGGGEGKSLLLKCLFAVFGVQYVFPTPEAGNYPLLDLHRYDAPRVVELVVQVSCCMALLAVAV